MHVNEQFPVFLPGTEMTVATVTVFNDEYGDPKPEIFPYRIYIEREGRRLVFRSLRMMIREFRNFPAVARLFGDSLSQKVWSLLLVMHFRLGEALALAFAVRKVMVRDSSQQIVLSTPAGEFLLASPPLEEHLACDLLGMDTDIGQIAAVPASTVGIPGEAIVDIRERKGAVVLHDVFHPESLEVGRILSEKKAALASAVRNYQPLFLDAFSLLEEDEAGIFYDLENIGYLLIDRSRTISSIMRVPMVIPSVEKRVASSDSTN